MGHLKDKKLLILSVCLTTCGGILFVSMLFLNNHLEALTSSDTRFDSLRAFADIEYQMSLGPRTLGSEGHLKAIKYIQEQLQNAKWQTEIQEHRVGDQMIWNVVAQRGKGFPWIILGAHFDTRLYADRDPDPNKRQLPVPGANDGASGVAVLLELARVLPKKTDQQIWLVFFDAEDNGGVVGLDWIMGSRVFVDNLQDKPDKVVIVDMVGDSELELFMERNSNKILREEIWEFASFLGYDEFIPRVNYALIDDHTPFLQAGIPAVDIIDFEYPYWHTTADTLDKVSANSLDVVGETLLSWLLTQGK